MVQQSPSLEDKDKKGRAMEQIPFINLLGYIALAAMAFTILIPLFIAIKHCRTEKWAKKREQKHHAQSAGHSLS